MSAFNWGDISINNENPEAFFNKRHIKHERVYYDLMSGRDVPKKVDKLQQVNKENKIELVNKELPKKELVADNKENKVKLVNKELPKNKVVDNLTKICEKKLKISVNKTESSIQQPVKSNDAVLKCKANVLPPARPKAYDYAEIYKKRKEMKAIEAGQKVILPPIFKSKPLPTFYRSTKTDSNAKPNRITIPITPMVLKRSTKNKKIIQNK